MSEWNYDTTGIEIGQFILAHVETDIYESVIILNRIYGDIFSDMMGSRYHVNEVKAWMPRPKPPKKKHRCQVVNVICESFMGGLLISVHGDFAFPVNFCPFCGEKAND